jgi:hypothetical protein
MEVIKSLIIFLLAHFFFSCMQKEEVETVIIDDIEEVESMAPPDPGFKSPFNTIEEWLENICNEKAPPQNDLVYNFGIFSSDSGYTVSLEGLKRYEQGPYYATTNIAYTPKNTFFDLPRAEYSGLSYKEAQLRLTERLKKWIASEKFKNCFLKEGKTITTDAGEELWKKK